MFFTSWTVLSPPLLTNCCTFLSSVDKMCHCNFEKLIRSKERVTYQKKEKCNLLRFSSVIHLVCLFICLWMLCLLTVFCHESEIKSEPYTLCFSVSHEQGEVHQIFYAIFQSTSVNMPHRKFAWNLWMETYSGHSSWNGNSAVELSSSGYLVKFVLVLVLVHCHQSVHCNWNTLFSQNENTDQCFNSREPWVSLCSKEKFVPSFLKPLLHELFHLCSINCQNQWPIIGTQHNLVPQGFNQFQIKFLRWYLGC